MTTTDINREVKISIEKNIRFIIFKNENRLKGHLCKHFLDIKEYKQWKIFLHEKDANVDSLLNAKPYKLKESIYNGDIDSGLVKKMEKFYIDAIIANINNSLKKPRFAIYYSQEKRSRILCALSDTNIIIHCYADKGIFNVASAYAITGKKYFSDNNVNGILKKTRKNIKKAATGEIEWSNTKNWGFY
jgi:hypothetical protein